MKLRSLKDKTDGNFFLILPITICFGIVALIHILVKIGVEIPNIIQEPVFQVWILFLGVVIGFCVFMRQIFLMLGIIIVSSLLVFGYYALYVI